MNTETGQLIKLGADQKAPDGFHPVPLALSDAARAELASEQETVIDPAGRGPMSQYLRDRRCMMQKRKARNRRLRKGKK